MNGRTTWTVVQIIEKWSCARERERDREHEPGNGAG